VCCSALQRATACCSVLMSVALCCSMVQCGVIWQQRRIALVLQCVAACVAVPCCKCHNAFIYIHECIYIDYMCVCVCIVCVFMQQAFTPWCIVFCVMHNVAYGCSVLHSCTDIHTHTHTHTYMYIHQHTHQYKCT